MKRLLFLVCYRVLVAIGDGAAWIAARCYDRTDRMCFERDAAPAGRLAMENAELPLQQNGIA